MASDGSSSDFSFVSANAPTYGKDNATLRSEGWITADGVLAPAHDAARAQWGGAWRMPTQQEFDDLNSKCDWVWTTQNGVDGYIVSGRGTYSSNSIFIPCAGYGIATWLNNSGPYRYGHYWSSVPNSDYSYANGLLFAADDDRGTGKDYRDSGLPVRPVQGSTK